METSGNCLAVASAMALGLEYKELIKRIGHDGREIIFPELPEPGKRRAHHLQEIIDVAIDMGIAVTPIEALPYSTPDGIKVFGINFKIKRFRNHLIGCRGIITGMKKTWRHAVYWDGEFAFESPSTYHSYENLYMDIDCFYRFTQIKSS